MKKSTKKDDLMKKILTIVSLAFLSANSFAQAVEEDSPKNLKIYASQFEPNVFLTENGLTGFDIDLVSAICEELGLTPEFELAPFNGILNKVATSENAIAVGGISITKKREEIVDFTYPYLVTGKDILVLSDEHLPFYIKSYMTVKQLLLGGLLLPLTIFLSVWLGFSLIFFSLNKGSNADLDDLATNIVQKKKTEEVKRYNLLWGMIWSAKHVMAFFTTVGDTDRADTNTSLTKKRMCYLLNIFMMIFGGLFLATMIGSISSKLTTMEYDRIKGREDLEGKRVAVVEGTTSQSSVESMNAFAVPVPDLKDAYLELFQGNAEAVVSDAISLSYYANERGAGRVKVVGNLFDQDYYGIVVPPGSSLTEDFNRVILSFIRGEDEEKIYQSLLEKWELEGIHQ